MNSRSQKIGYKAVEINKIDKSGLTAANLLGLEIRGESAYMALVDKKQNDGVILDNIATGGAKIFAIDRLGQFHYLVTADPVLEFELKSGELVVKLGGVLLNTRTPNVICATNTKTKDAALFLVDARTGRITKLNAVERGKHASIGRVLNDNVVLVAAGNTFYGGLFDPTRKTFVWTRVGEAPDTITFLGRVDGDYILGAMNGGNQIVVKGVAAMTSGKSGDAEFLTVMQTIPDTAMPVGKVAGDMKTFAMFRSTKTGDVEILFAPWTNSDHAPAIVRAVHDIRASS